MLDARGLPQLDDVLKARSMKMSSDEVDALNIVHIAHGYEVSEELEEPCAP